MTWLHKSLVCIGVSTLLYGLFTRNDTLSSKVNWPPWPARQSSEPAPQQPPALVLQVRGASERHGPGLKPSWLVDQYQGIANTLVQLLCHELLGLIATV